MASGVTQRFLDALHALERDRKVEGLVGLYAEGAEIGNVVSPRRFAGPEGAREFWTTYRATFGEMESTFRNVIEGDGRSALEWTTTGTSPDGKTIEYAGVSILEIEGDQITRFWAYFNPSLLGHQLEGRSS